MNMTDDAEKVSVRRASTGMTVVLVLALWVGIVLVLASVQILLNRGFGIALEVGSLPGVWDWVLAFAIVVATWVLVRRRHPKVRP